ncbi:MAG: NAD(P)/FAD-dependent oxidoreductase [Candidatus Rokuibacteriota bacterium]
MNQVKAARVVIIGGGVAGCAIAYHLARGGWRDVLVLERGELTGGSTFHAAGLVGQLRASIALSRINMASVVQYRRLDAETGRDPGWREVGSLRLASSRARLDELRRRLRSASALGLDAELFGPGEAAARFPLMSHDGVKGALWLPSDGRVDPASLAHAFAAGAKKAGVSVRTGVTVTGLTVRRRRVSEVVTEQGRIACEVVVDAAGIWAAEIGRLADVPVPVVPIAHQYLVTKPIDGVRRDLPTMRDPDHLVYFREEVGGLVVGGFERAPAPWGLEGIPRDFNHKLLSPDWDRFAPLMEQAIGRVPILSDTEVITLINGPEAFTPDGEFILGEAPAVRGFFVAAGFCAHGIAGAGGVGEVMAGWIMNGRPPLDVRHMDIRRFGAGAADGARSVARAVAAYATYYDVRGGRPARRRR